MNANSVDPGSGMDVLTWPCLIALDRRGAMVTLLAGFS